MTFKNTYNELCKAIFYFFMGALLTSVPIAHFCSQGPGNPPLATVMSGPTFVSIQTFRVTAYCPCEICCEDSADGITANGYKIQPGDRFVAAPKEYPFGTKMLIPGYSNDLVLVQDRGGAIKGNKLDVYFDTHSEALEWGVKTIEVKVYQ